MGLEPGFWAQHPEQDQKSENVAKTRSQTINNRGASPKPSGLRGRVLRTTEEPEAPNQAPDLPELWRHDAGPWRVIRAMGCHVADFGSEVPAVPAGPGGPGWFPRLKGKSS